MSIIKTYSISSDLSSSFSIEKLHKEINDTAVVAAFNGLNQVGDDLHVLGDTLSDATGLDDIISAHEEISLAEHKKSKLDQIDYKTGELISAGFAYDGKVFSLSVNARGNWNNLKHDKADFAWPKEISTIDSDSYSLSNANVNAFWTAGKDVVDGVLDSGRVLKKSVYDAVDKAAVDLVIDNR